MLTGDQSIKAEELPPRASEATQPQPQRQRKGCSHIGVEGLRVLRDRKESPSQSSHELVSSERLVYPPSALPGEFS